MNTLLEGARSDASTIGNVLTKYLNDQVDVILGIKEEESGLNLTAIDFDLACRLLYGRQDWKIAVNHLK